MTRQAPLTPVRLSTARGERLGIVVFGGSFDPPHRWHIRAVLAARAHVRTSRESETHWWIMLIPAARSPLKSHGPIASDADRLAMARLAVREVPRAMVWPDEIARARWWRRAWGQKTGRGDPHPSFTIDTIRRLRRSLGAGRGAQAPVLRLLVGADQALAFHRWRSFRALMRLAEPLVVLRPPVGTPAEFRAVLEATGAWSPAEIDAWMGRVVAMKVHPMSSTGVREGLVRGRRAFKARWLSEEVRAYIARRGLYASDAASPKPRSGERSRRTVTPATAASGASKHGQSARAKHRPRDGVKR